MEETKHPFDQKFTEPRPYVDRKVAEQSADAVRQHALGLSVASLFLGAWTMVFFDFWTATAVSMTPWCYVLFMGSIKRVAMLKKEISECEE